MIINKFKINIMILIIISGLCGYGVCVVAVRQCGLSVVCGACVVVRVWFVLCVWWCGVCLVVSCARFVFVRGWWVCFFFL